MLVAAGNLKRKEPETDEDELLIRAMRDSNVPKFMEHDLPLFAGIIADLFPGIDVPSVDHGALLRSIEARLEDAKLQKILILVVGEDKTMLVPLDEVLLRGLTWRQVGVFVHG